MYLSKNFKIMPRFFFLQSSKYIFFFFFQGGKIVYSVTGLWTTYLENN